MDNTHRIPTCNIHARVSQFWEDFSSHLYVPSIPPYVFSSEKWLNQARAFHSNGYVTLICFLLAQIFRIRSFHRYHHNCSCMSDCLAQPSDRDGTNPKFARRIFPTGQKECGFFSAWSFNMFLVNVLCSKQVRHDTNTTKLNAVDAVLFEKNRLSILC